MVSQNTTEPTVKSLDDMKSLYRRLKAKSKDLPPGEYLARLKRMTSHVQGTPFFLLTFVVVGSEEHYGKEAFRKLWVTEKALPKTVKDLAKIGIYDIEEIEEEVEPDLLCKIWVNDSNSDCNVAFFAPCDA